MPGEVDPNLGQQDSGAGGLPPGAQDSGQEQDQRRDSGQEQRHDGPGSGRTPVRKQLEQAAEQQRRAQIPTGQQERDRQTGRYTSRARQEAEGQEGERQEGEGAEGEQRAEVEAPQAWAQEARQEWANLPPAVQEAVLKREQDTANGVKALQDKYKDVDAALAPRMELLRQGGHTPAAAINQLFSWFEALTTDAERIKRGMPPQAFFALAQSFGLDPRAAFGLMQQGQQQQGQQQQQQVDPAQQQQQPEIPPHLQQWWSQQMQMLNQALGQKFGSIEQAMQAQGLAKANEVLDIWSKDKPYFQEVRGAMAQLLQNGMVATLPNGNADLDKAYDMALYALPEVRAKVLADQQKAADAARKAKADAERKAQQDQADKARRAAVALGPSAPGAEITQERKKGKSVRESLQESIEQVRGQR